MDQPDYSTPSGPDPVDIRVGERIKARRVSQGMSQERLGEELGITFQQVQKYERATNRVSASRLVNIARVLDITAAWLLGEDQYGFAEADPGGFEDNIELLLERPETHRLVRAYYKIRGEAARNSVYSLMLSLAGDQSGRHGT